VNALQTSHNVDEVTCGHCKKTEQFKSAVKRAEKKKAKEAPVEKSYVERQEDWIKENDIKVGDKVRVVRVKTNYNDKWETSWTPELNKYVGRTGTITDINFLGMGGLALMFEDENEFIFPYYELEKVIDEAPCMVGADYPTISNEDPTLYIREFSEDSLEYQFLDNLLESICGGQELRGYQYVEFNPREGYSILREDKDKNPRIFRVVVREMELREKRRYE
jgi:hypothetical protein